LHYHRDYRAKMSDWWSDRVTFRISCTWPSRGYLGHFFWQIIEHKWGERLCKYYAFA